MRILLSFSLLAGTIAALQFAVRGSDGSWYLGNALDATVEKRSHDLANLFWKRTGAQGGTWSLRATMG